MTKKERALQAIALLKQAYPDAGCTLDYDDAWKLLVSVRLAAQCTDARVNVVVEGLYAKYPTVQALAEAPVEEIEAIVKPCGLGRSKARDISACMKMLQNEYGGKMIYQGKEVHFKSALEAKNAGICLVFQEVSLMTDLSIAENIFVGQYPTNRLHMIDYKAMRERAKKCLDLLDFPMDPMTPVSKLSLAQQQLVEIAKALVYDPKLIILDEPTSSLTDKEKQVLFKNINALKESGVAVPLQMVCLRL